MTATLAVPVPATTAGRVTTAGILRSETTKFRSLRSSWWTLGVALVIMVGFGALVAANFRFEGRDASPSPAQLVSTLLVGVVFAQLATAVLGVLMMSGEYGTGMIRTSMTVVPKRLPVLWAKAAVYVTIVLPLSLVGSFVTFFLGSSILSSRGHTAPVLTDPGVLREVVGSSLYITVAGLFALGVATLLRHTAAGVSTVVGIFFVVPIVANFLPTSINGFAPYLPSNAGGAVFGLSMADHSMAPWTGFALLAVYAAALLAAAAVRLRRTDV